MDEFGPADTLTYRSLAAETTSEGVPSCVFNEDDARALAVDGRSLPSFFIVGPPRTGSSWLYEILSSHVVLPAPSKETRFFDIHFDRGFKWYLAHYKNSGRKRRVGEVAPTYFASAQARERLSQTVPDARIVCVFRNPAERIISLYRLKRAYGLIPWSFEEAMYRDPELLETSRYASNLKRWQRSFGAANVRACLYDDLRENPQWFVDGLADFVGVSRFKLEASQLGSVHDSERMTQPRSYARTRNALLVADWFKSRRLDRVVSAFKRSSFCKFVLGGGWPFSPMPQAVVERLYEKFRPEVEELEEILRRDLSSWKFPKAKMDAERNLFSNEGARISA
jgi:Sulfotransferase domain